MQRTRFGEFDFHPESGELRRRGVPIKLPAQPAQLLGLLIDARGELVSRDALRSAIWSDGTTVDFDRGINFCVAQIRSALGDSAESPLYIRTIPKRGYQFIAPLAEIPKQPSRRAIISGWGVAAAAAIAGTLWVTRPRETRIAVIRFDNDSGNPTLDRLADSLTDLLVAELTAGLPAPYGVIGNAAGLRLPRQQRNIKTLAAALEARYVVLGQVQTSGSGLRVLAHLIRMPEQTHLKVVRLDLQEDAAPDAAQRIVQDFARILS